MEKVFKQIVDDYIEEVGILCSNLLDGLKLQDKQGLVEYLYMGTQRIWELDINGVKYKFHGSGCNAYYDNKFIQWDFGRRSHWCGLDPWFIANTLKMNKSEWCQYYDGNFVKQKCEAAVKCGEMYCVNGRYYYTIPLNGTFKPSFPKEFDSIVIEYFDDSWVLPRNKEIERFIRKSTYVYEDIEKKQYNYNIKFINNGDVVCNIPYNDTCYPESAVVIMSDNIICNLKKSRY